MTSKLRIFVSSTYVDLVPYRAALENLVREYGVLFAGMEYFGARNQPSLGTCLQEVGASDIVIVLVGARYGTASDDGRSFTHREVDHARTSGTPVFVFVQENPISVSKAEAARRESFVRWLGKYYTWARFTDTTTLVTQAAAALRRFELRDRSLEHTESWREIIERSDSVADWDCVTISAHNVDRLYSVDLVAADYETRVASPAVVPGGSGANTIAGLGRMGLRVAAAGFVGNDADGAFLRSALQADGVVPLLAPVGHLTAPTGTTLVFTDPGGRRSIYVNPGANERFAAAARSSAYRRQLRSAVRSTRILHYSSFTLAPERGLQELLLSELPERAILSFTPGALYCKLGLDRLAVFLQRANVLFLYEQQLDALLGEEISDRRSASTLREKIERIYEWKREHGYNEPLALVIKNAPNSSSTVPQQIRGVVGRTRVELSQPTQATIRAGIEVRDSTGAGDASATGLLWAILQKEQFNYALDVAYVFARSVSQEYGPRSGLPTAAQLHRRWKTWVGSPHRL